VKSTNASRAFAFLVNLKIKENASVSRSKGFLEI